jgi:4-amino-4-deoxy-L-arabinose transferase-like glycosyltransferase
VTARTPHKTLAGAPNQLVFWLLLIGLILVAAFLRVHQLAQTPPGLFYDEAFYGLDARHVLDYGHFELFFAGDTGREPLHIYLLALAEGLLGERAWTIRLVSAFSGIVAVPLIYCLGRALWRETGERSRWIGLLAAAALAVSYWHVNFSRLTFRAIDLVPVTILAVWLLWRGAQKRSRRLIALSGVALGVSLYTFLAARVFPGVFVGLAMALVLLGWGFGHLPLRTALRQPLVTGSLAALAVAVVVCLPLGAYFALHPDQFSGRMGGVSLLQASAAAPGPGTAAPTLTGNLVATVRMFVDRGDAQARQNLPGRPAVDWVGQIGLAAGLVAALWRWRQPRSVLLVGWLVAMLLPTTLSLDAPHFLRALGALPPLCLLVAGGLAALWGPLMAARPRLATAGWPALLIGVVAVSGSLTYRDYFWRWAPAPTTADVFDTGRYLLGQRALALSQTYDVVVPLQSYVEAAALFSFDPVFKHLAPVDEAVGAPRPARLLAPPGADLSNLVLLRRSPGQPAQALVLAPLEGRAARALAQLPASGHLEDALGRPVATTARG